MQDIRKAVKDVVAETIGIMEATLKGLKAQRRELNATIRDAERTLAELKSAFSETYGNERKESE